MKIKILTDRVFSAKTYHKFVIKHALNELKGDKEVVLEAVKQNGHALQYASVELKNDKEVVLETVKQDGGALYCASDELRNAIFVL